MNKKMKFVSIVAAMAMTATMGASAFATATSEDPNGNIGGAVPTENGTEVWAGVAVDNPDMRIKVTVPTLFAFVVNGTVDTAKKTDAITVENGGLLLPNVKVENVTGGTPTGGTGATYDLTTTGSGSLTFENYSTYYDSTATDYKGLEVDLNGTLKAEVGATWKPVAADPAAKYEYRVSLNGASFDTARDGGYGLADAITLTAPSEVENGKNIDTTTKLAKTPYVEEAEFGVEVGGTRGDYSTAENSAKVGTIVWKVSTQQTVPAGT